MEAGGARQQTSTQTLTAKTRHKHRGGRSRQLGDLSLKQQPQVLCCCDVYLPFSAL